MGGGTHEATSSRRFRKGGEVTFKRRARARP